MIVGILSYFLDQWTMWFDLKKANPFKGYDLDAKLQTVIKQHKAMIDKAGDMSEDDLALVSLGVSDATINALLNLCNFEAIITDSVEEINLADAKLPKALQEQAAGLGNDFLDEIEQGLHRIRQFPLLCTIYEGEYRRYLFKRFPYGLIYRIENEKIFIIAVAHLHRNPGYWKYRE